MAIKFRTKLLFSRTGVFDSIGIGVQNPNLGLHVSGADLTLTSGSAYFDNRPTVSGIPVMVSGDVASIETGNFYTRDNPSGFITGVDLSNHVQFEYVNQISGNLNSKIELLDSNINNLSGFFQSQINNLAVSVNGASIVSDYVSGISYVGRALVGSSQLDPVWTIKRITITSSGTISGSVRKSANSVWNNRYNLNYI